MFVCLSICLVYVFAGFPFCYALNFEYQSVYFRWPSDPPLETVRYEHNVVNEQRILETFFALREAANAVSDTLSDPLACDDFFAEAGIGEPTATQPCSA